MLRLGFLRHRTQRISQMKSALHQIATHLSEILRGFTVIPGELLRSSAHFRFTKSAAKLNSQLYIYNQS